MVKNALSSSIAILLALIFGSVFGSIATFESMTEVINQYADYVILLLVFLVLLDVQPSKIFQAITDIKILSICLITNFILIPLLGFGLAYLFLNEQPIIALGVAIYCMSPCTDWFLGFTRMAGGNTALGGVLLPINMLIQFLLYPVYLLLFSSLLSANSDLGLLLDINFSDMLSTLLNWFIMPAGLALAINLVKYNPIQQLKQLLTQGTDFVLYLLVFCIFAVNINSITQNYSLFAWVLLTVLLFFGISFMLTEFIAKKTKLNFENKVLYTMTTTARNAPLMLGLTMTALPEQPLIYTTIIVGMLIEFPYLAMLAVRFNYIKKNAITDNDSVLQK